MSEMEKEFINSMGIEFILLKPGKFIMGSDKGKENEKPAHEVEITKAFYLSKYPVTTKQFGGFSVQRQTIMIGGLQKRDTSPEAQKCPITSVSWQEANAFCQYVARRDKRAEMLPDGTMFRLPTEAEWEYACRAGTTTEYYFGDECSTENANIITGSGKILPVDTFPLNPWGLGDFHGNAAEWVMDRYSESWYKDSPAQDPTGPDSGELRVVRGGSYSDLAEDCRSASRTGLNPVKKFGYVSFRLVRTVT